MQPLHLSIKPSTSFKWHLRGFAGVVTFSLLYAAKLQHDYLSYLFIIIIPACWWYLHNSIELYAFLSRPTSIVQLGCQNGRWWVKTRRGQKSWVKAFKNSFYLGKLAILNITTKERHAVIVIVNEALIEVEWQQLTKYLRLHVR